MHSLLWHWNLAILCSRSEFMHLVSCRICLPNYFNINCLLNRLLCYSRCQSLYIMSCWVILRNYNSSTNCM